MQIKFLEIAQIELDESVEYYNEPDKIIVVNLFDMFKECSHNKIEKEV